MAPYFGEHDMRKTILAGFLILLPIGGQPMFADDAPPTGPSASTDAPTSQPADSEKVADIHKLLNLSGSGKIGVQVVAQMIPALQKALPTVPQDFWDDFQKEIHPEELEELIVPIYDKHFSHEDIKKLIAFYESPIGKKLAGELPSISQESMQAGQQWGRQIAQKAIKEVQEKQQQQQQAPAQPAPGN
jgi:uncharacterized protein